MIKTYKKNLANDIGFYYITIVNNTLNTFYFKQNYDFRVPKVFISINLLHPYLRPLLSDEKSKNCYYFQILEIFSAIIRKTNEDLSNAILAGNKITFDYNENYLYVNLYCYEDVAYNITKKIKKIIFDTNWNTTDFLDNNTINHFNCPLNVLKFEFKGEHHIKKEFEIKILKKEIIPDVKVFYINMKHMTIFLISRHKI